MIKVWGWGNPLNPKLQMHIYLYMYIFRPPRPLPRPPGAEWLWSARDGAAAAAAGSPGPLPTAAARRSQRQQAHSLSAMLSRLLYARDAATHAGSTAELAWEGWWEQRGSVGGGVGTGARGVPPVPPPAAMKAVLSDLLQPPTADRRYAPGATVGGAGGGVGTSRGTHSGEGVDGREGVGAGWSRQDGTHDTSQRRSRAPTDAGGPAETMEAEAAGAAAGPSLGGAGSEIEAEAAYRRSAPPGSMLWRLALHALVFGNARAVAELWQR